MTAATVNGSSNVAVDKRLAGGKTPARRFIRNVGDRIFLRVLRAAAAIPVLIMLLFVGTFLFVSIGIFPACV